MSKPRTRLFTHIVPLIKVEGTEIALKPDLLLVIKDGKIRTSRLNPMAPINRLISLVDDLLEELKDERWAEETRKGKTLKKK
jgi:uncharacterized spore protein YtfJ